MDRDDRLERYKRIVAAHEGVEVKGAKTPYTAINGNMFSFLDDQGCLCLRFSEHRKADLNAQQGTTDVLQYGAVMKGYVRVPEDVLGKDAAIGALFAESLQYARGLKPKPTKKGAK